MKRDDVTGLAPTGDLGLIDKSSFLLDSLLLMFGPDGKKNKFRHSTTVIMLKAPKLEPWMDYLT